MSTGLNCFRRVFGLCTLLTLAAICGIQAQKPAQKESQQQVLDFIAKPLPASSPFALPASYPKHFADWTDGQKKSGVMFTFRRCMALSAMMHDDPNKLWLSGAVSRQEESTLIMTVCVVANMPNDWPARSMTLHNAEKTIDQANAHGASIHLPTNLAAK